MNRSILAIFLFLSFAITGCASNATNWTDASVEQVHIGMKKSDLIALLGEPVSTTAQSNGKEVLIFKRASDEAGLTGKYLAVMTLGTRSGKNAVTVDALRVVLKNDAVTSYKYTENVDNNFGQAGLN